MQKNSPSFSQVTDAELIRAVKALAAAEREATVRLLVSLAELDARRLYLGEGFPSLFAYCTQCLHLSEHAAYNRIEAARAVRQWPEIHARLADGSLTLTSVRLLAPHLTMENLGRVLDAARHKSKRDVERIVAALHPQPDVPATIRKLPPPKTPDASSAVTAMSAIDSLRSSPADPLVSLPVAAGADAAAVRGAPIPLAAPSFAASRRAGSATPRQAVVAPLTQERYKVQFTVSAETYDKLRRAQDLLRHTIPNGDPAAIFDRALTLLVAHLEKTKLAAAERPRTAPPRGAGDVGPPADSLGAHGGGAPWRQSGRLRAPGGGVSNSRHIPAAVKRAVWERDAGRCGFVGLEGRCAECAFLEFHHVIPYADGGAATVENIQLRCRSHNQYEADAWFGAAMPQGERCEVLEPDEGPSG